MCENMMECSRGMSMRATSSTLTTASLCVARSVSRKRTLLGVTAPSMGSRSSGHISDSACAQEPKTSHAVHQSETSSQHECKLAAPAVALE